MGVGNHWSPGPVWLDIPGDIQNAQIDPDALKGVQGSVIEIEEESIEQEVRQVAEWLKNARRPMLHIGQGVPYQRQVIFF